MSQALHGFCTYRKFSYAFSWLNSQFTCWQSPQFFLINFFCFARWNHWRKLILNINKEVSWKRGSLWCYRGSFVHWTMKSNVFQRGFKRGVVFGDMFVHTEPRRTVFFFFKCDIKRREVRLHWIMKSSVSQRGLTLKRMAVWRELVYSEPYEKRIFFFKWENRLHGTLRRFSTWS